MNKGIRTNKAMATTALFPSPPPTCKFLHVNLLTTLSDCPSKGKRAKESIQMHLAYQKTRLYEHFQLHNLVLFPPTPPPPIPTSHDLQYISVRSGFTRLSIKTKYVCLVHNLVLFPPTPPPPSPPHTTFNILV